MHEPLPHKAFDAFAETRAPHVTEAPFPTPARSFVMLLYVCVGVWYLFWRLGSFNEEASSFSLLLYAAELFGFVTALLHLMMTWRLTEHEPQPPPQDLTVDVFIPTINEPVDIVRRTRNRGDEMLSAQDMAARRRRTARDAEAGRQLGCDICRADNVNAKAGNLNNALAHSGADFVAVFDADHAPRRDFLERRPLATSTTSASPSCRRRRTSTTSIRTSTGAGARPYDLDRAVAVLPRDPARQGLLERSLLLRQLRGRAAQRAGCDRRLRDRHRHRGPAHFDAPSQPAATGRSITPSRSRSASRRNRSALHRPAHPLGAGRDAGLAQGRLADDRGLTGAAAQLPRFRAHVLRRLAERRFLFRAGGCAAHRSDASRSRSTRDFYVHFIPYYLLTFLVFEEVARGYGRTILLAQYNLARYFAFLWATFGLFYRNLKFYVTDKTRGSGAGFGLYMVPQYAVLLLNALAIPLGIILYLAGETLPETGLVANVVWATVNCMLAIMLMRFNASRATNLRTEYRFPIPLIARVKLPGRPSCYATVDDISPAGCRLHGQFPATLRQDSDLRGEILMPQGALPFVATVRGTVVNTAGDAVYVKALCCRFDGRAMSGVRSDLERFLYGSRLQWAINRLREQSHTPLSALPWARARYGKSDQLYWAPVLLDIPTGESASQLGLLSCTTSEWTAGHC